MIVLARKHAAQFQCLDLPFQTLGFLFYLISQVGIALPPSATDDEAMT